MLFAQMNGLSLGIVMNSNVMNSKMNSAMSSAMNRVMMYKMQGASDGFFYECLCRCHFQ
jgi:hypothetical protein